MRRIGLLVRIAILGRVVVTIVIVLVVSAPAKPLATAGERSARIQLKQQRRHSAQVGQPVQRRIHSIFQGGGCTVKNVVLTRSGKRSPSWKIPLCSSPRVQSKQTMQENKPLSLCPTTTWPKQRLRREDSEAPNGVPLAAAWGSDYVIPQLLAQSGLAQDSGNLADCLEQNCSSCRALNETRMKQSRFRFAVCDCPILVRAQLQI